MKEIIEMLLDFSAVSENRGIAIFFLVGAFFTATVKIVFYIRGMFKDYLNYLWKNRKKALKENYEAFLEHIIENHTDKNGIIKISGDENPKPDAEPGYSKNTPSNE